MYPNWLLPIKLLIYKNWCTIWGSCNKLQLVQNAVTWAVMFAPRSTHLCFASHIGYQFASGFNLRWWWWQPDLKAGGYAICGIIFPQLCLPIHQKDHVVESINERMPPDITQEESIFWYGTCSSISFPLTLRIFFK